MYRADEAVMFAGDCKYTQSLLDEFTSAQCVLHDTMNSTRTDCNMQPGWRKFCLQWNFSNRLTVTNFSLNFALSFCCCCTLPHWFLNVILAVCFHYLLSISFSKNLFHLLLPKTAPMTAFLDVFLFKRQKKQIFPAQVTRGVRAPGPSSVLF